MTRLGSLATSRVPMRAPMMRPMSWAGSTPAATKPRAFSSRPNWSSYMSEASDTKPMREAARNGRLYQMRRRVSIFQTIRQPSAKDGATSSVSMTASLAPMARRSWPPRGSAREMNRARITNTRVGMVKTKKGIRQPKALASRPAVRGPMQAPTALAARWKEYTRGRTAGG